MNVLSLFSGIGGLELGLERAGMTVVGQVEIDPFCRRVLEKHWPEVPKHDDVRTAAEWWRAEHRPRVDLVAGGFPCQPVSQSGRRLAQADPRWLWPLMDGVLDELRPTWVVIENVPDLRVRGLADVFADLHLLGYTSRAGEISACAMGAPHRRRRLFVLAHTKSIGRCPWRDGRGDVHQAAGPRSVEPGPQRRNWWASEPDVGRVAHGVPGGVDRRRALGNAVVPQVSEYIGRLIMSAVL